MSDTTSNMPTDTPTYTILVPLDGSEPGRRIFPEIQKFFAPQQVTIRLLRVASPPSLPAERMVLGPIVAGSSYFDPELEAEEGAEHGAEDGGVDWQEFKKAIRDELATDARALRGAGYRVSLRVTFGNPEDEILSAAENDIDLIAMTTQGRTGLSRMLAGSIAEQVLRRSVTPVLLIRIHDED
ncbi:MAG: universal stress protein [Trueperaceae bacterium]|nr:universal stress protein [Trueperaceae bacterium]